MRKRRQIELAAAPPFSLFDPHCLESYGVSTKHKIQTNNAEKPPKTAVFQRFLVGVRGLEPRASCSQSRRATNCATPRYLVFYGFRMYSQSKRATNCANPGFLVIEFCARCGQTCGQAVFLTTSTCGGNACIAGVSRDCGHGVFRLEGGATRSQTRRDTNFAIPGYLLFSMIPRRTVKIKFFLSVVIYVV